MKQVLALPSLLLFGSNRMAINITRILKIIPIVALLFLTVKTEAQYFYINDVGTSSLNLTNAKDIKLSSSLFIGNNNFVNMGYSPIKHIGVYAGYYSNKQEQEFSVIPKHAIIGKGKGFNTAIGFYYFKNMFEGSFYEEKERAKGVLFYSKIGYSQSNIRNEFSLRGDFMIATFEYEKLYFELGVQVITKKAKIDFNFKNTYIKYLNGEFNGNIYGEFNGYYNLINENFAENNLFKESELNIQGEIGGGYISLITGIPIFFPKKDSEPSITYKLNRPLYIGINIDIDDFYKEIKK